MPQIDVYFFLSQFFWSAISLATLYVVADKFLINKIIENFTKCEAEMCDIIAKTEDAIAAIEKINREMESLKLAAKQQISEAIKSSTEKQEALMKKFKIDSAEEISKAISKMRVDFESSLMVDIADEEKKITHLTRIVSSQISTKEKKLKIYQ